MNFIFRLVLGTLHRLLKLVWFLHRPRTFGAHALALTPDGKVILVRLRYAPGWRLPGGGRREDENPRDAVLRELREEFGLISHGEVQLAAELEEMPDFKRDHASLFVVRDVRYQPHWSWEIEQVTEAPLNALPPDLSPRSAAWLEALRDKL
ncbi:MAG TPA: NUDIX domain-containing protein [Sphingomicrobium sp.]|nr:NUDIX domain-containing protein [Sphingomicrobium sp.]